MAQDCASLPARVGFNEAPGLLESLSAELAAMQSPCVDLSACQHFDSSLVGMLLELMRRLQASGHALRLINPPENLLKLALLYGVNGILFDSRT